MNSSNKVLKINPRDNLIVALSDLKKAEIIIIDNQKIELKSNINSKHKFLLQIFSTIFLSKASNL